MQKGSCAVNVLELPHPCCESSIRRQKSVHPQINRLTAVLGVIVTVASHELALHFVKNELGLSHPHHFRIVMTVVIEMLCQRILLDKEVMRWPY